MRWPFFSRASPARTACAEMAPSALATGAGPNFMAAPTRSGFLRKAATISPAIETAISAGLTAPMSRPIGAWMRASAASSKPSAFMRSMRLACVFREPSAPM